MNFKILQTFKTLIIIFNLLLASSFIIAQVTPTSLLSPVGQPKFVNALPIPSVIDKRDGGSLTIEAKPMTQWLGIIDPITKANLTTNLFGYNGKYPGPTILAKKFEPLSVNWDNKLVDITGKPLPHLLPIDNTIHWAFRDISASIASNGIPLVTHLHGGHTEWQSDGYPTAWYTPNYVLKGKDFQKVSYQYKNDQEAATIWYHDHTLGLTRVNVMAGLAGLYIITDENEEELKETKKLPAAPYDIPLFLQDRQFKANGQIFYPSDPTDFYAGDPEAGIPNALPSTSIIPEFFGNFMLVNGMTWPVLEVEPRQYRFRVLNGADSRMYNMMLLKSQDVTMDNIMNANMEYAPSLTGLTMTQIGTDDGLLSIPARLQKMFIAPGERKDIIVDFSGLTPGQEYVLTNNANGPFPMGDMVDEHTSVIMKFKVSKPLNTKYPLTAIPGSLRPSIATLTPTKPAAPRQVILKEVRDEFGRLRPSLGTVKDGAMMWMDPTTETVQLNDTEEWEIYNETMDAHPIHLHSVSMQLVNRQFYSAMEFDPSTFATKAPQANMVMSNGSVHMSSVNMTNTLSTMVMAANNGAGILTDIKMIGNPILPTADELGRKDTWVIYPGQVMRVRAKFDLAGSYVWHCHILSHEDHDMMRPLEIVKNNSTVPTSDFLSTLQLKTIPNPFTEKCMVQFYLKASAKVTIELINGQGQVVKKVFNGNLNQGAQNFTIEGDDLPTGTFTCKVTVGNQVVSTSVVHLKK